MARDLQGPFSQGFGLTVATGTLAKQGHESLGSPGCGYYEDKYDEDYNRVKDDKDGHDDVLLLISVYTDRPQNRDLRLSEPLNARASVAGYSNSNPRQERPCKSRGRENASQYATNAPFNDNDHCYDNDTKNNTNDNVDESSNQTTISFTM
ncbi:hypothetical protein PoB_005564300 [Plakobranchus ocellatus]|uniref:Uncharacterized protein n=1 Tax=Plakobranchus ocellatus TaxID=259542 RepID=A0AAV4CBA0_9GAST|nr:hypothetical protein PoB_005564300 [Plakobranchus ocellatus]